MKPEGRLLLTPPPATTNPIDDSRCPSEVSPGSDDQRALIVEGVEQQDQELLGPAVNNHHRHYHSHCRYDRHRPNRDPDHEINDAADSFLLSATAAAADPDLCRLTRALQELAAQTNTNSGRQGRQSTRFGFGRGGCLDVAGIDSDTSTGCRSELSNQQVSDEEAQQVSGLLPFVVKSDVLAASLCA